MLEVVGDHADQPYTEGDRRVPALVHHPVQVGVGQVPHIGEGPVVHGVVVPGEQGGVGDLHLGDVGRAVAVTDGGRREGQPEALLPALRGPDLVVAGDLGDVVVLYSGEVPDQPGDRVGLAVGALGELVGGQPVDGFVHHFPDPAEGVGEQFSGVHGDSLREVDAAGSATA